MTSKENISRQMKKIRSKDTKPELILRSSLWKHGVRYRKNFSSLPGKPDIAITKYKIAVFVDGEFWHGYDFEEQKKRLHHNREKWIAKITRNMARDVEVNQQLTEMGWKVLRFPSKEVIKETEKVTSVILEAIQNKNNT